ncbi:hypothetical protein Aglo03_26300 [Actinokineospora globicatena]|uniref:Uncharacterized protein n=1 Tax=Actinokineospora globicatena TaxID=103729 RepID=A0A9W6QNK1_9PSEU|nr:hypothetical protein Aglo03_26300 [Actinokineospora globicatena]
MWQGKDSVLTLAEILPDHAYQSMTVTERTTLANINLDAEYMRKLAAQLLQRADIIDLPKPRPWTETPSTPAAIISEYLRYANANAGHWDSNSDPEQRHRVSHLINGFTIVALMAELVQQAPARAAEVAQTLADCWDDGGSVHEFLHQWKHEHAAGHDVGFAPPITLALLDLRRKHADEIAASIAGELAEGRPEVAGG